MSVVVCVCLVVFVYNVQKCGEDEFAFVEKTNAIGSSICDFEPSCRRNGFRVCNSDDAKNAISDDGRKREMDGVMKNVQIRQIATRLERVTYVLYL